MIARFLETGQIVGTHGVRGEVRVHPWSDTPAFLTGLKRLYLDKEGQTALKVTAARVHGNLVLVKFEGVDDIPAAERLRNKVVFCDRRDAAIEEGAWFVQDLLGCAVLDADTGARYGTLTDVTKTGANDVWAVTDESGKTTLIPAIPDVVIDVDPANEKVTIRPLKGLFDDDD